MREMGKANGERKERRPSTRNTARHEREVFKRRLDACTVTMKKKSTFSRLATCQKLFTSWDRVGAVISGTHIFTGPFLRLSLSNMSRYRPVVMPSWRGPWVPPQLNANRRYCIAVPHLMELITNGTQVDLLDSTFIKATTQMSRSAE